jgi:DNA-binding transcriptional regulator YiaG
MYFLRMSPETTSKLIADLKAWRDTHRVKQVELASMLGVSPQAVTEWFKGRSHPSGKLVLVILELLKRKPEPRKRVGR